MLTNADDAQTYNRTSGWRTQTKTHTNNWNSLVRTNDNSSSLGAKSLYLWSFAIANCMDDWIAHSQTHKQLLKHSIRFTWVCWYFKISWNCRLICTMDYVMIVSSSQTCSNVFAAIIFFIICNCFDFYVNFYRNNLFGVLVLRG